MMENQVEKIVGQKCIGYQRELDDSASTVIQNTIKLENGKFQLDWQIQYANGSRSLPLDKQPRIDILP
ncbi:MAG TPA: hypothetical protein VHV10_16560 [Ktedonobacteraceae bacterium]|jgi:hypothetical protein|nr:hypothetical protein [Ktedonobacteraceae bacterium]